MAFLPRSCLQRDIKYIHPDDILYIQVLKVRDDPVPNLSKSRVGARPGREPGGDTSPSPHDSASRRGESQNKEFRSTQETKVTNGLFFRNHFPEVVRAL